MSSGMNMAEAEEIAKKMTYRDAVYNALQGKCIPFKKATKIKLNELLDILEQKNKCESKCDDCMYHAPNINANSTCLNGASCTQEPCQSYETRKDQYENEGEHNE